MLFLEKPILLATKYFLNFKTDDMKLLSKLLIGCMLVISSTSMNSCDETQETVDCVQLAQKFDTALKSFQADSSSRTKCEELKQVVKEIKANRVCNQISQGTLDSIEDFTCP
ncbi:MAG: hypothetical protein OHK0038_11260 [Flammeovirgaceae bacterium]